MSGISPVSSALTGLPAPQIDKALPNLRAVLPGDSAALTQAPTQGFGTMLDRLVSMVETKQAQANELTKRVLLGDSGQLHQSVIAMQEASTAFSLMVEVRNKLVDSYQELMRMQV